MTFFIRCLTFKIKTHMTETRLLVRHNECVSTNLQNGNVVNTILSSVFNNIIINIPSNDSKGPVGDVYGKYILFSMSDRKPE